MQLQDWIDVPALKGQSKHTTAVAGVIVSLFLISRLASWLLGDIGLVCYIKRIDDILTVVAVLFYGARMIYHMVKGGKVNGSLVMVA